MKTRTVAGAGVVLAVLTFVRPACAQGTAAGTAHTTVVKPDGTLWTWGANSSGQLGDGTTTQRVLPVTIGSLSGVARVADGDNHSLAVLTDGTVRAWGYNAYGQLGDGTTTQRTSPVQVAGLSGVTAVAAGSAFSIALKSDGTVWTWGNNSYGQLGDGTTTQRTSPVQVSSVSNVIAIAAGGYHALAVKSDGTVWAWGNNANGQLGDGTTTQRTAPVLVNGLTGVSAVTAGTYHSLALGSDGTVKAWGYNAYGQLGDGTTTQRLTAVSVTNLASVTAVAAGGNHSIAVRQDLSLWTWGNNDDGELGDGTTTRQSTPVATISVSNIATADGGAAHTIAITSDGTVWAWGKNSNGQLGDGTTVRRISPIKVSETGYAWKVGTPTFSFASGTYQSVLNVTVATATAGATIHYTTNGVDPTQSDPTVASGGTVTVSQSLMLKAKAWATGIPESNVDGNIYTLKVPLVTLSPGTNTYNVNQNVTVSTTISGATIHYTTNGVDPTEADPTIASGRTVPVTQTLTLKAKAWNSGWTASDVSSATYTMQVGTPTISPAGGNYPVAQTVTVTDVTTSATLHYTTSGLEPTENDSVIASGGTIAIGSTTTLRVKGWESGWTVSTTRIGTYTFNFGTVATPTFTPAGGNYSSSQTVTVSTTTTGATIRYTLDGSDPTLLSPVYTGPLAVAAPTTIQAKAFLADWTPSATASAAYTFDNGTVAIPTLMPPGGSYATTQTVTVATTTAGATIHYTTTGIDPESYRQSRRASYVSQATAACS